jgi:Kef-type K+ transport system membrane component KefB
VERSLPTLVIIVVMVAAGALVARAWRPQEPDHGLGHVPAARLVVVLVVAALAVAARIAVGPLADSSGAVTGVVVVLVAIAVLILTGYARIPPISRTRR